MSGADLVAQEKQKIRRIERNALAAAFLLTAGSFVAAPWRFSLSVALGAAVMSINLHLLRRIVEGVILRQEVRAGRLFLKVGGHFILFLGLAAVAFQVLRADVVGFALGTTNLLLAVAVQAVREFFHLQGVKEGL
ncbi:MAG: ATP synthase subunit I [Candidatus Tectomicrobia bacterium]|uniref:ATP synthase subunit I n=1 Tax=Tectimicrobiota bacterium TaxID=2528274 RepID=A0A932GMZ3_UNCTE|nr:ATP synthase subunit I [Candidatus Tectomicrobia bacterium]